MNLRDAWILLEGLRQRLRGQRGDSDVSTAALAAAAIIMAVVIWVKVIPLAAHAIQNH